MLDKEAKLQLEKHVVGTLAPRRRSIFCFHPTTPDGAPGELCGAWSQARSRVAVDETTPECAWRFTRYLTPESLKHFSGFLPGHQLVGLPLDTLPHKVSGPSPNFLSRTVEPCEVLLGPAACRPPTALETPDRLVGVSPPTLNVRGTLLEYG